MSEQMSKTELLKQIKFLEKKQVLLEEGLKQSERIKKLWQQSVNDLRKIKIQLAQSEHELRLSSQVMEYSTDGIFITDANELIKVVNPAFSAITGYSAVEVINKTPKIFSSGRHDAKFYQDMKSVLNEQGIWQGEIWNRHKKGEIYPEWLTICAVKNEKNVVTNYIAIFTNITQQKAFEDRLRYLADHDALTGLPNRALFKDRLSQSIRRARREKSQIAVLFFDLDYFKQVNDKFGHGVGDLLLQEVAARVQQTLREEDTVARLGGDEFTIILNNIQDKKNAKMIAEKILDVVSKAYVIQEHHCVVGCSIGVALYPQDSLDKDQLPELADKAMYCAKEQGRNRVIFYQECE
ncbi:MAG: diguanylate cyclase [Gammaproteobacteria bacterium]|nr:diguanylate cyclase [Gammaproteobacteria bacterium]MBU2546764.1 diguanylate cyclase [Gammaproteobacteria bacterium]